MRVSVPEHRLSVDTLGEWVADPIEPGSEHLGLYLRSLQHGVYLNVRAQDPGKHALSKDGLLGLLREQNWGASIDEWSTTVGAFTLVGGSFETSGMGGEIVLEMFLTDGRRVANLAAPAPRTVIAALRSAAERLAATIHFE